MAAKKGYKMSILIDILLVCVVIVFTVWFSREGFAMIVHKMGKTWMSLLTSLFLGPFVAKSMKSLFLLDALTRGINNTLNTLVANSTNGYNLEQLFSKFPRGLIVLLEYYNISLPELMSIYGSTTEASEEIIYVISQRIATPASEMIANLFGHIACFIVAQVFVIWISIQIRKRRVRFLRYVDHINGFLMGVICGACVALGLSVLTHAIFQIVVAFNAESTLLQIYDDSYIFKFLCEFNILSAIGRVYPG